jgi:myo-inositol-1(or 4)-monophosphatase
MSHADRTERFDEYLAFAHRLADASGQAILPHFRSGLDVANKAAHGYDPVTVADVAAESVIRKLIRETYPGHGIFGEEEDRFAGEEPMHWVIDPIDGTRAFVIGQPLWGTLIALNDGRRPILGMLDQPFLRERFIGGPHGSLLRTPAGEGPLRTRKCTRLEDAILSSTHPDLFKPGPEADAFRGLAAKTRMTRYGGDCYAYGLLAMGLIDLVVEAGLKPYDIQALIPIVEGAGGILTDWKGGSAQDGGQAVACGDPSLHERVLKTLSAGVV